MPAVREEVREMELYINNGCTERYDNAYIAEAIACSKKVNHATIYTVGLSAKEPEAKLMGRWAN